jgi:tetratricopeptide (TPR) repeat protein
VEIFSYAGIPSCTSEPGIRKIFRTLRLIHVFKANTIGYSSDAFADLTLSISHSAGTGSTLMITIDDTKKPPERKSVKRRGGRSTTRQKIITHFLACLQQPNRESLPILITGAPVSGKSHLLQILRQLCTEETRMGALAEAVNGKLIGQAAISQSRPFPTAYLDFAVEASSYHRPQDPLFGLLMLRRELAKFQLRFAIFDFACLIYLHKTAQLTPERIRGLFPMQDRGFIFELADLIQSVPFSEIKKEVFNVISHSYREHFTPYMMHRAANASLCERIQMMKPESELLYELALLFAEELKTAVALQAGPQKIVLFFDSLDAFSGQNTPASQAIHSRRTLWVRHLVHALSDVPGFTLVLASRDDPDWQNLYPFSEKKKSFQLFNLDYFSEKEADDFLKEKAIHHPAFQRYFKLWAQVGRNRYKPLHLCLCCDLASYSQDSGRKLDPEEFRILPDTEDEKLYSLIKKFFQAFDREQGLAIIAANACCTIDPANFLRLSQAFYFEPLESFYLRMSAFPFSQEEPADGNINFRFHESVAANITKYGNKIVRAAHRVMLEFYQEQAARGDETAEAKTIYHLNCLRREKGVLEWVRTFERALDEKRYNFLRLLLSLSNKLYTESDYWKARIVKSYGDYYAQIGQNSLAAEFYESAYEVLDNFLTSNPTDVDAVIGKGVLLLRQAEIHARENRFDMATACYKKAILLCDELIRYTQNLLPAYCSKVDFLASFGKFFLAHNNPEEAEKQLDLALATIDLALGGAPRHARALQQKAVVMSIFGALNQYRGKNETAIANYGETISIINELLRFGEETAAFHTVKCSAQRKIAALKMQTADFTEAESKLQSALSVIDSAIQLQPADINHYMAKCKLYLKIGEIKYHYRDHVQVEEYFNSALEICNTILAMAPADTTALSTHAFCTWSFAEFYSHQNDHKKAETLYRQCLHDLKHLGLLDKKSVACQNNLGTVFLCLGKETENTARYVEAIEYYSHANDCFSMASTLSPSSLEAQHNSFLASIYLANALHLVSRYEEAEVYYKKTLSQIEKTIQKNPNAAVLAQTKAICQHHYAEHLISRSEYVTATENFKQCLAIYHQCLQSENADMNLLHLQCLALIDFGMLQYELSEYSEALASFQQALAIVKKVLKYSHEEHWAVQCKGIALNCLANHYLAASQFEDALELFEQAHSAFELTGERFPDDLSVQNNKGLALSGIAEVFEKTASYEKALEKYQDAANIFSRILQSCPDDLYSHNNLGLVYSSAKACYENALEEFSQLEQLCPNDTVIQNNHICSLLNYGNLQHALSKQSEALQSYNQAIFNLQKILQISPNNINALNIKGLTLLRMGDLQYNMSEYKTAIENYEKAIETFNDALNLAASNRLVLCNRGNAFQKMAKGLRAIKNFDEARDAFQASIASYEKQTEKTGFDHTALFNKGLSYLKMAFLQIEDGAEDDNVNEMFNNSILSFEQAKKLVPNDPKTNQRLADALLGRGLLLAQNDSVQDAEESLSKAVKFYEALTKHFLEDLFVLFNKGLAYLKLGNLQSAQPQQGQAIWSYQRAAEDFLSLLKQHDSDTATYKNLGETYASLGDLQYGFSQFNEAVENYKLSVDAYDSAIQLDAQNIELKYFKAVTLANLAGAHIALNDPQSAITSYSQSISMYQNVLDISQDYKNAAFNLGLTLTSLGNLYHSSGHTSEAITCFNKAIEIYSKKLKLSPDDAASCLNKGLAEMNLAEILSGLSRFEEARESYVIAVATFKEAAKRLPEDVSAHYNKGLAYAGIAAIYLEESQLDQAKSFYKAAIKEYDNVLFIDSENIDSLYNKGVTFMTLGQLQISDSRFEAAKNYFENAMKLFKLAIGLAPSDVQVKEAGMKTRELLRQLEGIGS